MGTKNDRGKNLRKHLKYPCFQLLLLLSAVTQTLTPGRMLSDQESSLIKSTKDVAASMPFPVDLVRICRAAVMKARRLSGLNSRSALPQSFGGQTSKIKGTQQGGLSLRAVREALFHASLLASSGLLAILGVPWLVGGVLPVSSHLLPTPVCTSFSTDGVPFIKTLVIGLGGHLLQYDLNLTERRLP